MVHFPMSGPPGCYGANRIALDPTRYRGRTIAWTHWSWTLSIQPDCRSVGQSDGRAAEVEIQGAAVVPAGRGEGTGCCHSGVLSESGRHSGLLSYGGRPASGAHKGARLRLQVHSAQSGSRVQVVRYP